MKTTGLSELSELSDEELIHRALSADASGLEMDTLFRRYYPVVARWSFRFCRDHEEALELSQEVFLRVHTRIDSFRMESRFSTWLYKVARNVAINRAASRKRTRQLLVEMSEEWEPSDPAPSVERLAERQELVDLLRRAMVEELDPIEAKVMELHFIDGVTLEGVTQMLKLANKSGAKAYIVSGKRKLSKRFGRERGRVRRDSRRADPPVS